MPCLRCEVNLLFEPGSKSRIPNGDARGHILRIRALEYFLYTTSAVLSVVRGSFVFRRVRVIAATSLMNSSSPHQTARIVNGSALAGIGSRRTPGINGRRWAPGSGEIGRSRAGAAGG